MKKVLLDTNALMAVAEFKIDIFRELELCCDFPFKVYILEGTIEELQKIKEEQRGKYKQAAQLALSLVTAKRIVILKKKGSVDGLLVEESKNGNFVLTQDIALKQQLTKPYLTIRQQKKIMVVR